MPFMEWESAFELGIKEFDEHHKQLVYLINLSYDSFIADATHEEVTAVLDELVNYATYHFAAEEYWMEANRYPDKVQHGKEHETFCHRVSELQRDVHNSKKHLSLEVLRFLHSWLTDHILKTDADYGRFAKTLG